MNIFAFGQKTVTIKLNGKEIAGREVILPLPPSVNQKTTVNWSAIKNQFAGGYYSSFRSKKGCIKNTTAYNRWINAARCLLRKGHLPVIEKPVCCFVTIVFKDYRIHDGDNRLKALFDAGTKSECLYKDDSLIKFFSVDTRVVPEKEFVVMHVIELEELGKLPFQLGDQYLHDISETLYEEEAKTETDSADEN